jgi:hypothetical protein
MASEKKKLLPEEGPSTAETLVKKIDPISKLIGYGAIIIATGFSAGVYYRGNQADLEKMRMDQECNTRVHQLEISLSDAKRDKTASDLESLNQVVKQLQQQQQHGK